MISKISFAALSVAISFALFGLSSMFASCKRTSSSTAYSCELGRTIRSDGTPPVGPDPFTNGDQEDPTPSDDLQEPWNIIRSVRVERDRDIDQLLNYKRIAQSERSSSVPMLPYSGALVLNDPAGGRPILVAVKTDYQTLRISNTWLKDPTTFILDKVDFDDRCYITDGPLAVKILSIMKAEQAAP